MFKVYKFRDISELESHLQGAIVGGSVVNGFTGLENKTLVFTQPAAATCTFTAGATPGFHTFAEVVTQLEAAVAGLRVSQKENRLRLKQDTPTPGNGVIITGGTARSVLGLSSTATSTGIVYNAPGGASPAYVHTYYDGQAHVLVVTE